MLHENGIPSFVPLVDGARAMEFLFEDVDKASL